MLSSGLNLTKTYDYEWDYDYVLFFERKFFDPKFLLENKTWINQNWRISILYAICYVVLVHVGQRLMRDREKFRLYRSLVAWNIVLAAFSILGSIRFLPNFFQVLRAKGLVHSVCVQDYEQGVSAAWAWLYMMSKMVELIDTAFIILRKQKLIFLHWYHHAITLVYTWFSFRDLVAYGRWFIAMNFSIHSIMYSYYVFRALRFNIPKSVSIAITSLQLLQMVVGIYVNLVAAYQIYTGGASSCSVTSENIYFSFLLYFTFFLLFFHYFRNAYLKKDPSLTTTATTTTMTSGRSPPKPISAAALAARISRANEKRNLNRSANFWEDIFKKIN